MKTKPKVSDNNQVQHYADDDVVHLPLKVLVNHPQMVYRGVNKEWAETLSKSIEDSGLDTPLTVWNGGSRDSMMKLGTETLPASFLIAGAHRREALRMLFRKNPSRFKQLFPIGIPCVVKGGSIADAMMVQLRENLTKREITSQEVLPVMKELRDTHGLKGKEIAEKIGKSPAWVSMIYSIEENVGEEGMEALKESSITLNAAKKVADKIKAAKKEGKAVSAKKVLEEEVEKIKTKRQGAKRARKRVGLGTLWKRYNALPNLSKGTKIEILEGVIKYVLEETDDLPEALEVEETDDEAPAKTVAKKVVKKAAKTEDEESDE